MGNAWKKENFIHFYLMSFSILKCLFYFSLFSTTILGQTLPSIFDSLSKATENRFSAPTNVVCEEENQTLSFGWLTCHPNNGNITNRVKAIALLGDSSAFADAPIISNFEFPSGNSVEELHISGHDKMPSLELEPLEVLYVTENALLSSLVLTGLTAMRCLVVSH